MRSGSTSLRRIGGSPSGDGTADWAVVLSGAFTFGGFNFDPERESLTVLTLGPLTNLADALLSNPALAEQLGSVFVMGGALHVPGNNNPTGVAVKSTSDTLPFSPYYTLKDGFAIVLFILFFAVNAAAAFVVTISSLFALIAFGLPSLMAALGRCEGHQCGDVIQTYTGPLTVAAAGVQIALIPIAAVIGLAAFIGLAL